MAVDESRKPINKEGVARMPAVLCREKSEHLHALPPHILLGPGFEYAHGILKD